MVMESATLKEIGTVTVTVFFNLTTDSSPLNLQHQQLQISILNSDNCGTQKRGCNVYL